MLRLDCKEILDKTNLQGQEDYVSVGPETDRGRTLLDGLEGVFNLVEATLWRPGRDIVVVLVAELFVDISTKIYRQ